MHIEDCEDARQASDYLKALRESDLPHPARVHEVRRAWDKFRPDPWVAMRCGWVLHDAVKDCLSQQQVGFDDVLYWLKAMAVLIEPMGDLAVGSYIATVARHYRGTAKRLAETGGAHNEHWQALAERGEKLLPLVEPHLSHERNENADGEVYNSDHDLYLDSVRKSLLQANLWDDCASLCEQVLAGELAVWDNLWYGHALLKALASGARTSDATSVLCETFVRERGDHEQVQLALAHLRCSQNDLAAAEEAFQRSIALSNTPWPWRDYAVFLLDQQDDGGRAKALDLLLGGLAWLDREKPGLTWELHFRTSKLLTELEQIGDAAIEVWLACEVRSLAGWRQLGEELDTFLHDQAPAFRDTWSALNRDDVLGVLRSRRPAYVEARQRVLRSLARHHVVFDRRDDRGLAFARPLSGEYDRAIIRGRRLFGDCPDEGSEIHAIAVPSWDRGRNQPSWRIAWMDRPS